MSESRSRYCVLLSSLGLLAGLGSFGCGGDDHGRPVKDSKEPVESGELDGCKLEKALLDAGNILMLSDFEDLAATGWTSTSDETDQAEDSMLGGSGWPTTALDDPKSKTAKNPPPCSLERSQRALRIHAKNLSDWGGQLYRPYNFPERMDASDWDGLVFWMRRNSEDVGRSMFIAITDQYTDEHGEEYAEDDGLPTERIDPTTGKKVPIYCFDADEDPDKCDRFGTGIGLETEWKYFKLPFSEMHQRGFGRVSPLGAPELTSLYALNIYFDVGDWDFWLDDFGYYKELDE